MRTKSVPIVTRTQNTAAGQTGLAAKRAFEPRCFTRRARTDAISPLVNWPLGTTVKESWSLTQIYLRLSVADLTHDQSIKPLAETVIVEIPEFENTYRIGFLSMFLLWAAKMVSAGMKRNSRAIKITTEPKLPPLWNV